MCIEELPLMLILQTQTQSYDIAGLAPYQLVTVTITATNGGGTSGNSNPVTVRTLGKLLVT